MEVKLSRPSDEGYERFELLGDITASAWAQQSHDPFVSLYGEDVYAKRVIIDMSKTQHVDSTGIVWILTCKKRFQKQGGKVVLHSLTPSTQRLFNMMRLHLVLSLAPSEDLAKSLLAKESA
jgi:anti-anti-sigma factor